MRANIKAAIDAYAKDGCPTGDFLYAVLSNNLREAIGRADEDNQRDLQEIVRYCWWEIPGNCWGSEKIVNEWLGKHAERREAEREAAIGQG